VSADRFEDAYGAGVVEEDVAGLARSAQGVARRAAAELAAPGGLAVGGCVLAPGGAIDNGYVVVGTDGAIAAVQATRPEGVPVLETGGVIVPGLIDLHGHPEFNVFPAWEPPAFFANRYEWRASDTYLQLVRNPQNRLLQALPPGTQSRYAAIRALVGGVTAVQGASGRFPDDHEALVRNVDLAIFGTHRARSLIDLPAVDDAAALGRLKAVLALIAAGEVTAFYIHLAEGRRDDSASAGELDRLVSLDALTPATVVIHGCALTRAQLGQVADAGAKLVWSPQSNLRLYGQTTDVAAALDAGVTVGLGADWLPSGSQSLLAELKVVRRVLAEQGRPLPARALVDMVTVGAAGIAGVGDHLGVLEPGHVADLVVFERHRDDPWENVVEADPAWVEVVAIGGDLVYGRADWMTQILGRAAEPLEAVVAWGKRMLLDTGYSAIPAVMPAPSLARLRSDLLAQYPQLGPIFA